MKTTFKILLILFSSLILNGCGNVDTSEAEKFFSDSNFKFLWGQVNEASDLQQTSSLGVNGFSEPNVLIADGHMVVTDSYRGRVLIWNSIPATDNVKPDIVLGQANFLDLTAASCTSITSAQLSHPFSVSWSGTQLAVADRACGRISIWNGWPTSNFQPANVIVNTTCSAPQSVTITGTHLISGCYTGGNLIDIWTPVPASNVAANVTLTGVGVSSWSTPWSVATDGTKLFAAVRGNRGLVVWNTIPTSNVAPDLVLGAPDLSSVGTGTVSNRDVCGANGFYGVSVTATKVAVSEPFCDGGRVLIWNNSSLSNYKPADLVLSNYSNNSQYRGQSYPQNVGLDDLTGSLIIGDRSGKIQLWNTIPAAGSTLPDSIFDGTAGAVSQRVFNVGGLLQASNNKLFAFDGSHHRILVWDSYIDSNSSSTLYVPNSPDWVIGQPNLSGQIGNAGGTSALSLQSQWSWGDLHSDGTNLVVADAGNHRILIWNSLPSSPMIPPDNILGQKDFVSLTANSPSVSGSTLSSPLGVSASSGKVAVADYNNNRVLIWNSVSTHNPAQTAGQVADVVLGQSNFTSVAAAANADTSLRNPIDSLFVNGKFVVADYSNHRILIWNSIPVSNQIPADIVLGQVNFAGGSANAGLPAPTGSTLHYPARIATSGTDLWVADHANHRVLRWKNFPTSNGQAADEVYGQPDFVSNVPNNGGLSKVSLKYPIGISVKERKIIIGDFGNSRMIGLSFIP